MQTQSILKKAKAVQKETAKAFKSADEIKAAALKDSQDAYARAEVEAQSLIEKLSELNGLPLDFYSWRVDGNLHSVSRTNYGKSELRTPYRGHYGETSYPGVRRERGDDKVMRLSFMLIWESNGKGLYVEGIETESGFVYTVSRSVFSKLEVKRGLSIQPGHAWKEPLNATIKTTHQGSDALVESLTETIATLIDVEKLEEMLTQSKRKTVLAKFLKTDIAKIEISKEGKDNVGVRFTVEGKGDFRILSQKEKAEYFTDRVATVPGRYFDLELFVEQTGLSYNDAAALNKSVTPQGFERVSSSLLGNSAGTYAKAYIKRHGFSDVFAAFEDFFIVDCSKV